MLRSPLPRGERTEVGILLEPLAKGSHLGRERLFVLPVAMQAQYLQQSTRGPAWSRCRIITHTLSLALADIDE